MVLLTRVVVTTLVTSQIGKETSVYIDFLIKRGRCYSIYLRYVQDGTLKRFKIPYDKHRSVLIGRKSPKHNSVNNELI